MKDRHIDWVLFFIICATLLYLIQFNWVYFIADEPKMLWMGKKCIENPKLFFSFKFFNKYHEYHRPLEKLLWGFDYLFFRTNPIPIQIFKRLLFLGVIVLIYYISKILGGKLAGLISTVLIFEYPTYRRYIDTLFVSECPGVFLFLIAVCFLLSWLKFPKSYKLTMSYIFSLLAFFCKETFGIIFIFLAIGLLIFFTHPKKKIFSITFILYVIILSIFLAVNINQIDRAKDFINTNYLSTSSNGMKFWSFISDNFRYYIFEELSVKFLLLFLISLYLTFKFFRKSYHLMFLFPALGGFILILPLSFHPYNYFMESYTNFIIFISVSLGLFWKEKVFKNIHKLNLGFLPNIILAILFLIIFISDIPSAINKFNQLKSFTSVSSYPRKKAVLKLLSFPPFSTVYIPPNWEAKQYFGDWLKLYGLEKIIKLQPITFQNIKEIVEGDNLLKDFSFQHILKYWKIKNSGKIEVNLLKKGQGNVLKIKKIKDEIVNFPGLVQEIQIDPEMNYLFGSWIKGSNFSKWTNLKVKEVNTGKYIGSYGLGGLEGSTNWRLLCAFYSPSEDAKNIKLIIANIPCFKRGEVWIWNPFFYKLKPGIKFLNYNF